METVTVKAYAGTPVSIPIEKKEEYLMNQEKIKNYLSEGKTIEEIKQILSDK